MTDIRNNKDKDYFIKTQAHSLSLFFQLCSSRSPVGNETHWFVGTDNNKMLLGFFLFVCFLMLLRKYGKHCFSYKTQPTRHAFLDATSQVSVHAWKVKT